MDDECMDQLSSRHCTVDRALYGALEKVVLVILSVCKHVQF
jgi:hypothetical protein